MLHIPVGFSTLVPSVVVRIRIWQNPNILASSESESEKKFGFGFGFGSRHCCKIKFVWKIADQTLEREKNIPYFFQLENFFLCRTDSEKMSSDLQHCWSHYAKPEYSTFILPLIL
jgi:hypothetical protein